MNQNYVFLYAVHKKYLWMEAIIKATKYNSVF